MGIHWYVVILEDLLLIVHQQPKRDGVGIRLNGQCEELNLEWNFVLLHELQSQPESFWHYKNLCDLIFTYESLILFKEAQYIAIWEL